MSDDVDLTPFEGLIFTTAAMYAPLLDDDADDVRQILRIKVWQALVAFDTKRVRQNSRLSQEELRRRFVFSCVRNRMKDLFKEQDRLNRRRNGGRLFIEELTDDLDRFEGQYLAAEDPEMAAVVDGIIELPSTLSPKERQLVALLLLDYSRSEISDRLGMTRKKVLATHRSVQVKMADWCPPGLATVTHLPQRVQELLAA